MNTTRKVILGGMLLGGIALPGLLFPGSAAAQGFSNFAGAPTGPVVGTADDSKGGPRQAAPPALPGSRTQKTEVAPAPQGAGDMPPTEALFDSINRGDIVTARDAVNRGADISGRNVLGLTPLDLSIDLGRNEITFLLLSLRPANARDAGPADAGARPGATTARNDARRGPKGAAAPRVAEASPAAPARVTERPARATQDQRPARGAARPSPASSAPVAAQAAPATAQPAIASRQYANQREASGTPIPQMGFLGFGSVTR